jgi:hypothetical protein
MKPEPISRANTMTACPPCARSVLRRKCPANGSGGCAHARLSSAVSSRSSAVPDASVGGSLRKSVEYALEGVRVRAEHLLSLLLADC